MGMSCDVWGRLGMERGARWGVRGVKGQGDGREGNGLEVPVG